MALDGPDRAFTPALGVKAPDRQPMRNGHSRVMRSNVSEARKPLTLPTPTPVPRAGGGGERVGKRRVAHDVDDELSPAEQGLQLTKEQLARHLSRTDEKVQAIEAWRTVGHELLQAARRHFRAHKAHGLISQSDFNMKPVKLDFAKHLFLRSLSSLPVLQKAIEKPSDGLSISRSYKPNLKRPRKPKCDAERPGFSAFVDSIDAKQATTDKAEPSNAADGGQAAQKEADASGADGEADVDGADGAGSSKAAPRISKAEQRRLWDALEEDAKAQFARVEAERVQEYEAALAAEQSAKDNPQAVTLTVRDGDVMRKLLRLTSPQFQAFEYVSVAGHQIQQAVFEKLVLQYDVEMQHLKLRAFVGYAPDAPAASAATA